MKDVKVVIGANFGDEGKGLMTDYFATGFSQDKPVLNVRFNGGAQAGHTVVKSEDGGASRRHVFNSVGAGSFNQNVTTYLSPHFILSPLNLLKECEALTNMGTTPKVLIDKQCRVNLPCDIFLNHVLEANRGDQKHGSCGLGIWETVVRSSDSSGIYLEELLRDPDQIVNILSDIRKLYVIPRLHSFGITRESLPPHGVEAYDKLFDTWYDEQMKHIIGAVGSRFNMVDSSVLRDFDNVVFEGAQGLGLSWSNRKYMPNITASFTGMQNVAELIDAEYAVRDIYDLSVETCYTLRAYGTRHGAGTFSTECKQEELGVPSDATNKHNEFQDSFRYGKLNLNEIVENIKEDSEHWVNGQQISIAITHLDETDGALLLGDDTTDTLKEFIECNQSTVYASYSNDGLMVEKHSRTY